MLIVNAAMWDMLGRLYREQVPPGDSVFTDLRKDTRSAVCMDIVTIGAYLTKIETNSFACLRPESLCKLPNDLLSGVPCTGQ